MISGKNLRLALEKNNISQESAAEKIGKSRATIITWLGKAQLNYHSVKLIKDKLGIDLSDYDDNQDIRVPQGKMVTNNSSAVKKSKELIPFYPADFIAGSAEESDEVIIYPEYYMDIPQFYGCTAFNAYSDSMEKLIPSGCILFAVKIEDWMSVLEFGKIYGIVCNDGRKLLKYIRKDNNDRQNFILKSENPNYDDMDMPISKIKNIWLIDGWLVKNT